MNRVVQFPELKGILEEFALSINVISKNTGVSRNTLASMRDGKEVAEHSVNKLLKGLEKNLNLDVVDYRAALQSRISANAASLAVANAGPNLTLVAGSDGASAKRSAKTIAADLLLRIRVCADLASELIEAADDGDTGVNESDPRHIHRLHRRLNADLEEVYIQFQHLLPNKNA